MTDTPPAAPPSTPPVTPPPETWLNDLPEELRAEPTLASLKGQTWKEVGPSIVKSLIDTKKFVGADKMAAPQKNWTEKEWGEFYAKAGRPETPDKYGMPDVKLEDGVKIDDGKIGAAKGVFHKLGLSDAQAKGVLEFYLGTVNEQVKTGRESSVAAVAEAEKALRAEWGKKYDLQAGLARAALAKFGDAPLLKHLEDTKLGNHPELIKAFAKIGAGMMEDTAAGSGTGVLPAELSARQEIDRLKGDMDFHNRRFNGDKAAQSKWTELHRIAYPKETAQ